MIQGTEMNGQYFFETLKDSTKCVQNGIWQELQKSQ